MSFQRNDTIVYGTHGVCRIIDVTKKEFNGRQIDYFVLKPVYDDKSTIFAPADNPAVTAKMHRVLSTEEIYALVKGMPEEDTIWIEDENDRRQKYKAILAKGDRCELIRLIKTLYLHGQALKEKGKKLHISDDHMMKEAEKTLYEEFSHVLQIEPEQVLPFIINQIEVAEKIPLA